MMTRRPWRIVHTLAADGSLESTEWTYYDKPADDPDNPDQVKEQQEHCTIDHTNQVEETPGRARASSLTAGQRSGIASGITSSKAALARLRPLNPGPTP